MKRKKIAQELEAIASILEKAGDEGWPEADELKTGRFTNYCKRMGFDGPCIGCVQQAMQSDDSSVRGMAAYYANTVKPEGKTLADIDWPGKGE